MDTFELQNRSKQVILSLVETELQMIGNCDLIEHALVTFEF